MLDGSPASPEPARRETDPDWAAAGRLGGLPCARIGVTDGTSLEVQDVLSLPVEQLREAHEATLPALFGPLAGQTSPANPVATAPATGSVSG